MFRSIFQVGLVFAFGLISLSTTVTVRAQVKQQ